MPDVSSFLIAELVVLRHAFRKQKLDKQLDGQLKPVLRTKDFDGFNLEKAFELVRNIAEALPD